MSNVAQMRQDIEEQARASWAALYGLRQGGAEHRVIEARMTQCLVDLADKVGMEEACAIVTSFDKPQPGEGH
jgi:hypothetical protein